MARFIDLSHPLEEGQLSYPKDPEIHLSWDRTIESHGVNVSRITMGSHQGTHLDAPSHFYADGTTLDQIPLERFFGPARLVDLAPGGALEPKTPIMAEMFQAHAEAFQPGARVLYRTGWDRMFGRPEFFTDLPSLTLEAAQWIADRRIRLLGMDTPTPSKIAGRECHYALLKKGVEIVIVEGLANLDRLPERFTFIGFPLHLKGRDGSPIRAVARIEEEA
jgi:kynurenine formamidase